MLTHILPPPALGGLPRFYVILHYYSGHRELALRLLELNGARILTQPITVRGAAREGCQAIEVLVESNYSVIERLQDTLGLSVRCMKTGRFQVGYPAQRAVRVSGAALDAWRRGCPLADQARPARAPAAR